jgi:hypothetical protein
MWCAVQVGPAANSGNVRVAAMVTEPGSGIKMTVLTNSPGESPHTPYTALTRVFAPVWGPHRAAIGPCAPIHVVACLVLCIHTFGQKHAWPTRRHNW